MKRVRVALCQMNCRVGGIAYNVAKIKRNIEKAHDKGADIVCFPELAVCGYPPEDLLLKPGFIERNIEGLREIKDQSYPLTAVVGFVERSGDLKNGFRLHNAAAVISGGKVAGIYAKTLLPNYGVFDENRYFESGGRVSVFAGGGFKMGVNICEDIWFADGPAAVQSGMGADLIVNISASPYSIGKSALREKMLSERAKNCRAALAFCNMTGAQDELVFDGHSAFFDGGGGVIARARGFGEETVFADIELTPRGAKKSGLSVSGGSEYKIKAPESGKKPQVRGVIRRFAGKEEEIFSALVLGTRDYVRKNGFKSVVVGLSGGIDSALVIAVAVEALGARRVVAVNMPSVFSSKAGIKDAKLIAENLGVEVVSVPIDGLISSYKKNVPAPFAGSGDSNTALENIQARIRGNILMAFSNRFGWLVLTTGNKSELSVGYSTLYGDTAGGFAVIKDVKKTLVYELVRHFNGRRGFDAVPDSVIKRAPSAELRKGQRDSDALPPYEVLDEILRHYVESDRSVAETVSLSGADAKTVRRVVDMVDGNEYKRRQSPPGIRLTDKAFGKDRRMPITNFYRN